MLMRRVIVMFVYIRVLGPKTLGQADEYCLMETFNATCRSESEVVVIDGASYGRMRVGRCVTGSFGYLGCSVDVLPVLDRKCSGRRSCQFTVPDAELFKTRPCPGDFTSYLEASYHCQLVETANRDRCMDDKPPVLTGVCGYLASIVAEDGGFGSRACPWIIRTHPGQRINITLHNFLGSMTSDVRAPPLLSEADNAVGGGGGAEDNAEQQKVGVCFEVAALFDSMDRKLVTICSGDSRQSVVLLSKTNTVRVEFLRSHLLRTLGAFLLEYRVFGCGNTHLPPSTSSSSSSSPSSVAHSTPSSLSSSLSSPSPSAAAATPSSGREQQQQQQMWFRRNGETMMVGCNSSSSVVWYLVCKDRMWHGEIGNCSSHVTETGWRLEHIFIADDAFPFGILIIVMIGVATGIVVGGFILCLINLVTKREFRQREVLSTAKNAKLSQLLSERSPFLVEQRPGVDGAFAGWPCIPPQPINGSDDSQSTTIYYDSRRSIPGSNFLCDPCSRGHDLVGGCHDLNLNSNYSEAADDVDDGGAKVGNGRLLYRTSFSKSLRSECSLKPSSVRTHIYDYPQFATQLI